MRKTRLNHRQLDEKRHRKISLATSLLMINGFAPKVLVINITLPSQVHFDYLPFARDRASAFEVFQLLFLDATGDPFNLSARREVYSCVARTYRFHLIMFNLECVYVFRKENLKQNENRECAVVYSLSLLALQQTFYSEAQESFQFSRRS